MALITVNSLCLGYDGIQICPPLSFCVNRGEYVCVVGENGVGKSSLLKAILNLKKPLSGSVVFGENLTYNKIGYLSQLKEIQKDFPASVMEIILSGTISSMGNLPFYTRKQKDMAFEAAEKIHVDSLLNVSYRTLSGGQQQRVLFARALCAAGELLVLDEPVTGLDSATQKEMYDILNEMNKNGKTILTVTHDMVKGTENASHILCIKKDSYFFGEKNEWVNA